MKSLTVAAIVVGNRFIYLYHLTLRWTRALPTGTFRQKVTSEVGLRRAWLQTQRNN